MRVIDKTKTLFSNKFGKRKKRSVKRRSVKRRSVKRRSVKRRSVKRRSVKRRSKFSRRSKKRRSLKRKMKFGDVFSELYEGIQNNNIGDTTFFYNVIYDDGKKVNSSKVYEELIKKQRGLKTLTKIFNFQLTKYKEDINNEGLSSCQLLNKYNSEICEKFGDNHDMIIVNWLIYRESLVSIINNSISNKDYKKHGEELDKYYNSWWGKYPELKRSKECELNDINCGLDYSSDSSASSTIASSG